MYRKIIILSVAVATLTLGGVYLVFFFNMIDTNFATEATLHFSVRDEVTGIFINNEFSITDDEDIRVLKGILRGRAVRDSPACGFTVNVSIIMSGGERSSTFSPALDGCPLIRIDDSDRYIRISEEQRKILDRIFERYGLTFPAI